MGDEYCTHGVESSYCVSCLRAKLAAMTERAERAEKINAEYADARRWELEALKSRLHRQEVTERERDEARAELKTMTCMWNGLRDKLTEVRADLAQREQKYNELEKTNIALQASVADYHRALADMEKLSRQRTGCEVTKLDKLYRQIFWGKK